MGISYTNCARFMYAQMYVWAFSMMGCHCGYPGMLEAMVGVAPGSLNSGGMEQVTHLLGHCALTLALGLTAVAMMQDPDDQRKCLQYVSLMPLMATGAFVYNSTMFDDTMLYMNVVQNLGNFALIMATLYYYNEPGYQLGSDHASLTWHMRVNYMFQSLYAVGWLAVPDMVWTMSGMKTLSDTPTFTMMTNCIVVCMASTALLFIAGAQITEESQKHLAQYGMAAWLYFPISMGYTGSGMEMMATDPSCVKFYLALCTAFISHGMYCCYPATARTWILRSLYMLMTMTAVWLFTAPKFAWAVWGMSSEYEGISWLLGITILQMAGLYMAIAQMGADSQRKALQYQMIAYPVMCYYYGVEGVNMGDSFAVNSAYTLVICHNLGYFNSLMTIPAKLGMSSSMKSSTSTSMSKAPMRKRSATPAGRSKK